MHDQPRAFQTKPGRTLLYVVAWLSISSATVLAAQAISMRATIVTNGSYLPSTFDVTLFDAAGFIQVLLTILFMADYCRHELSQKIIDKDNELKARWSRAAKESMGLAGKICIAARAELTTIRIDSEIASYQLHNQYQVLIFAGSFLVLLLPVLVYGHISGLLPAAFVWIGLALAVAGVMLLRCRSRLQRDFPRLGSAQSDLLTVIEDFTNSYELALGMKKHNDRQTPPSG